jgi:hypothetical protein
VTGPGHARGSASRASALKWVTLLLAVPLVTGVALIGLWLADRTLRLPVSPGQTEIDVEVEIAGLEVPTLELAARYLGERRIPLVSYLPGIIGGGSDVEHRASFELHRAGDRYSGRIPARYWFLTAWNLSSFEVTAPPERLSPLLGLEDPRDSPAEKVRWATTYRTRVLRASTQFQIYDVTGTGAWVSGYAQADGRGTAQLSTALPASDLNGLHIDVRGLRRLRITVHGPTAGRGFCLPVLTGFFGELDQRYGWNAGRHDDSAFISGRGGTSGHAPLEPVLHLRPHRPVPLPILYREVGPVRTKNGELCAAALDAKSIEDLARASSTDYPAIPLFPKQVLAFRWPRRAAAERVHDLCQRGGASAPLLLQPSPTGIDVIVEAKPDPAPGPWYLAVGFRSDGDEEGGIDVLPVSLDR